MADPTAAPGDAEVLIIGAGPAGLALAASLADAGLRTTVLEQQDEQALAEPPDDGREIALTHRARDILQQLGIWQQLPTDALAPLRAARVLNGDHAGMLQFEPGQAGQLGWLVANHQIRRAALAAVRADRPGRPTVDLRCGASATALDLGGAQARVTLADGQMLRATLVVAADSRLSSTRRLAGIGALMRDFGRSVVVGPVHHSGPNDGIAWECFGYGNTLALLPMNGQRASAVVTLPSDRAADWLALSDQAFAARVQQQAGGRLGEMRAAGPRHHYPLVGVFAQRFVAPRFALIGDAAVGMHPVTAHGYNFGLYGVQALTQQLVQARQAGRDLGSLATLEPFERTHRRLTLPVYLGTNAVVGLFTDERPAARLARRAVLTLAEQAPGLSGLIKSTITAQLTGQRPALPGLSALPPLPGLPELPTWPGLPAWARNLVKRPPAARP